MTAMVQEFDGVRELSVEEVDAVAGGTPGHVISGVIGGMAGGASAYVMSGGNWKATAAGAATGAVMGVINPASSAANAARAIRAGQAALVGGVVGAGVNAGAI